MTTVKLKHPCLSYVSETILKKILRKVYTVKQFIKNVKLYCKSADTDVVNHLKGDLLELFGEHLVLTKGSDKRVGIYDYVPIQETGIDDNGVDGKGIGLNGKPATVQYKFRKSSHETTYNDDKIANFISDSIINHKVDVNDSENMIFITTAKESKVDFCLANRIENKVKIVGLETLGSLVDCDTVFWDNFRASIEENSEVVVMKKTPIKLREHQVSAVNAGLSNTIGRIIMPTGCGKTPTELEILSQFLKSSSEPVIAKLYYPRLILGAQLLWNTMDYLFSKGIDCNFILFNTGTVQVKKSANKYKEAGFQGREITSTTDAGELIKACNKSKKEGKHIIILITYHSALRADTGKIHTNISIFDEAHNTVNPKFRNILSLQSDVKLFLTATQKYTDSDDGFGMDNVDRYGEVIYQVSPYEMIMKGEMLSPRIHIVGVKDIDRFSDIGNNSNSVMKSIVSSYFTHEAVIKTSSSEPNNIGAKVLVCGENQDILESILKSDEMKKLIIEHPDISVYALSSGLGVWKNGKVISKVANDTAKVEMLEEIQKLNNSDRCLIFYIDMLGEGIDVPGITAMMPFRNCNAIKFSQLIGRGARLHSIDRARFYAEKISPKNINEYVKPYCWIIIPEYLQNSPDFGARYEDIVKRMNAEYGFNPSEHIIFTDDKGNKIINEVAFGDGRKSIFSTSGHLEFIHRFEGVEEERIINYDLAVIEKESRGEMMVYIKLLQDVLKNNTGK